MAPGREPRALCEHGEEQQHALRVGTVHRPSRQPEARRRHERLDFDEKRPRALDGRDDDAAGDTAAALLEKDLRRIGDLAQPRLRHLENADLVRGSEAVLRGAEDPKGMEPLALEVQHRVDDVLENARASDGTLLRHVSHEKDRDVLPLRELEQPRRALAELGDAAGA